MMLGAAGVWCGTRFLVANEAKVDDKYKQIVIGSKSEDTTRIEIFSGRPMRVIKNEYTDLWSEAACNSTAVSCVFVRFV